MLKKIIIGLVVLSVVALGILLLGPKSNEAPTSQQPTAGSAILVDIKGFAFVGKTTVVNAGTKVTWRNLDSAPHTVTSNDGLFDSKTMLKDQTFSYVFRTPGVYKYRCGIHPDMTGEIYVR